MACGVGGLGGWGGGLGGGNEAHRCRRDESIRPAAWAPQELLPHATLKNLLPAEQARSCPPPRLKSDQVCVQIKSERDLVGSAHVGKVPALQGLIGKVLHRLVVQQRIGGLGALGIVQPVELPVGVEGWRGGVSLGPAGQAGQQRRSSLASGGSWRQRAADSHCWAHRRNLPRHSVRMMVMGM